MFVRWKRKHLMRRIRWGEDPGDSLSAVLVESRRVDGRPKQRYVKHLGVIPERHLESHGWRVGFWKTADAALASLGLPMAEREAVEAQLAARVPRPNADEAREARAELTELQATIARGRRLAPPSAAATGE